MPTDRPSRRGVALALTATVLVVVAGGPVRGQDFPKPVDAFVTASA